MNELIYDHTTLNINLCNIIDLYSVMKPRCYSEELSEKTSHILYMLDKYDYKCNYQIKWSKNFEEWLCCYH